MIVAAVVLALVLIAREFQRAQAENEWTRERGRLVNALVARTPGEFVAMERQLDKAPKPERPSEPPVFIEGLSA